ncbi:primosomal protein N' [Clostridia bacterium]|nr:primosomal protein N' [Clostridia bacterium]
MPNIARTAIDTTLFHIDKPYDYIIPDGMVLAAGQRITVPFGRGNRPTEAMVLAISFTFDAAKLKTVAAIVDADPVADEHALRLALWISERFFCTVYEALRAILPIGLWRLSGAVKPRDRVARLAMPAEEVAELLSALPRSATTKRELLATLLSCESANVGELAAISKTASAALNKLARDGVVEFEAVKALPPVIPSAPREIILNPAQQSAYTGLAAMLDTRKTACALLVGVTGSGKTMVYIKLVEDAIKAGGGAIILVPEIALTPQLIATFSAYFSVAVLHSALGLGERLKTWKAVKNGDFQVVVGTRSAIFAPVPNLRLIVIDEEQEHTYKSENTPRYHVRDVAKFRCVQHGALLTLVSATPSIESAFCAENGTYAKFNLPDRAGDAQLPEVTIADLREDLRDGGESTIGAVLREEIAENLQRGEQTVLLLNRRGFRRAALCPNCGRTRMCPNCSVALTYHADSRRMLCHYCGHSEAREVKCAECGGELRFIGAGTQKVERDLLDIFPDVGILRMDADTTGKKQSHAQILERFQRENVPILVGTQMIAKGLNLPNVTLAGVINADMSLSLDDYRANERTFSLIAQVLGRAGRADKPGRAVIQTLSPENPILLTAAAQDYERFYRGEIGLREQQGYPPFGEILLLRCFGGDRELLRHTATKLRGQLAAGAKNMNIRVLGPAPATVAKVSNRFRYNITLCGAIDSRARRMVSAILRDFPAQTQNKGMNVYADLHPNGF